MYRSHRGPLIAALSVAITLSMGVRARGAGGAGQGIVGDGARQVGSGDGGEASGESPCTVTSAPQRAHSPMPRSKDPGQGRTSQSFSTGSSNRHSCITRSATTSSRTLTSSRRSAWRRGELWGESARWSFRYGFAPQKAQGAYGGTFNMGSSIPTFIAPVLVTASLTDTWPSDGSSWPSSSSPRLSRALP